MSAPEVSCPTCQRTTQFAPDNPWRPFCSERCRLIDLGAWASEKFRVPAQAEDPETAPDTDRLRDDPAH
jgi:endogenous inhibitor of DNA gyrase (YacG/DUF329 family)